MRQLLTDGTTGDHRHGTHEWKDCDPAPSLKSVFLIPVDKVAGQSRLVITAFFGHLTSKQRREVQDAYLRLRTFTAGYLRLWQLDRIRVRRVEALETGLDLIGMGVFLLDVPATCSSPSRSVASSSTRATDCAGIAARCARPTCRTACGFRSRSIM